MPTIFEVIELSTGDMVMNEMQSLLLMKFQRRQVNQSFQYNMVNATVVLKLHMEMKLTSVLKIWERCLGEDGRQIETTFLWGKKHIYLAVSNNPILRKCLFHQQTGDIILNNVALKVRKNKRLKNR